MPSLNRTTLLGNLTRDPEMKYTQGGMAICEFGLAINSKFKSGDEWKEEVTFVGITTFGRQAETCNEYLSKGRLALIEGRLKFDTWEAKDGSKRSKLSVVAQRVQFLGGRDGEQGPSGAQETARDDKREDDDDSIPF